MPQENQHHRPLLEAFSPPTVDAWRVEVERLLEGAPFDAKMRTRIEEDFSLEPLYTQAAIADLPFLDRLPGTPPYVRGRHARIDHVAWDVTQEIGPADIETANAHLLEELEGGATAAILRLDEAARAGRDPDEAPSSWVGRGGVSIGNVAEMDRLLDGVALDRVPLFLDAGPCASAGFALLAAVARQRDLPTQALCGAVIQDPLGTWVGSGKLECSLDAACDSMAEITRWCAARAPRFGTLWVSGEPYHNGGGHAVQELAFTLATAVEYLRRLEARDVAVRVAARHLRFSFALGNRFFVEIAKLRAARLLWHRVLEVAAVAEPGIGMWIHGNTSAFTKTQYDPHVNMLRATTQALSGIVGGVNSLRVIPFDASFRVPTAESRRLARNVPTIIREESHLGKILDPCGGSYCIERLTHDIAGQAWQLFQEVERRGGMQRALQAGFPQSEVARVLDHRRSDLFHGVQVRVGINGYPDGTQKPPIPTEPDPELWIRQRRSDFAKTRQAPSTFQGTLDPNSLQGEALMDAAMHWASQGASLSQLSEALRNHDGTAPPLDPIPVQTLTQPLEAIRTNVWRARQKGADCRVFVVTLGPLAAIMARLDFTTAFFEAGGFEVVALAEADAMEELRATTGVPVVALCGPDEAFAEEVPRMASMLKTRHPRCCLVLAGKPVEEALRHQISEAGVDIMITRKSNRWETLNRVADHLGVAQ